MHQLGSLARLLREITEVGPRSQVHHWLQWSSDQIVGSQLNLDYLCIVTYSLQREYQIYQDLVKAV